MTINVEEHLSKGEIKKYRRDCTNLIKIPRPLKEKMFKFARLYGKGLTEEEICVTLGVDEDELIEIKKAYKAKREILWLDAPVPTNKKKQDDNERNFYELIPEERDIEEKALENVIKHEIRQLLSQILSKRDYHIFCLTNDGKTQAEVGRICGISQKQVSKILQKIQREIAPAIKKYFAGDDSEIKRLVEARQKKEKWPIVLIKEHQELRRIVS